MKNVLVITYYWPPAGGPGVQRVLKFVKYLKAFNWRPYILTVKNGAFPALDESLLSEIPADIEVYKTFNPEPVVLYKKLTGKGDNGFVPTFVLNPDTRDTYRDKIAKWLRANLFIPDAKRYWLRYAVKKGLQVIKQQHINLIFTSSPPHTVQLIGRKLAQKSGLPWVADFRDPWTDAFWQNDMKRRFFNAYDKNLEKKVLRGADRIITVSADLVILFKDKISREYHIIPNGFDQTDFFGIKKKVNDTFTIVYIGNLSKNQPIRSLLAALAKLDKAVLNEMAFIFYGNAHPSIHDQIRQHRLQHFIVFKPYIPHREMVQKIVNAELLLLVIPKVKKNSGILTGKLFEYLAAGNVILGIGPEDGDAAKILAQTGCGRMFDYDAELTGFLQQQYHRWLKREQQQVNQREIQKYSRKNQCKQLVRIFEQVAGK
jgi:glycosyltransferase involved in cell wall biosynthesis